jgi:hypothetical protein
LGLLRQGYLAELVLEGVRAMEAAMSEVTKLYKTVKLPTEIF